MLHRTCLSVIAMIALSISSCTMSTGVDGVVFDESRDPLDGVTVTLTREQLDNKNPVSTMTTNVDGKFQVNLIGETRPCILVIKKAGFYRHKERIQTTRLRPRIIILTAQKP